MSILDELKAEQDKLRGIKAPRNEGAGHNASKGKSLVARAKAKAAAVPKKNGSGS